MADTCQPRGDYSFAYSGEVVNGDDGVILSQVGTLRFRAGEMTGNGRLELLWKYGPTRGLHIPINESFESTSIDRVRCGGRILFNAYWDSGDDFERCVDYVTANGADKIIFQSCLGDTIARGEAMRQADP